MTYALTFHSLTEKPDYLDLVTNRIWHAWWSQSSVTESALRDIVALSIGADGLPDAVVAICDGEYAGSALLIASDEDDLPHLTPWIAALWVEPAFRGKGIAGQMMADLRKRAQKSGIETVYLSCREALIPFYLGQGYQLVTKMADGTGVFSYPLRHQLRAERAGDEEHISQLTTAAFATAPHSSGTEAQILAQLRQRAEMSLSLVIEEGGEIMGHIAFSPVTIGGQDLGWVGLGPVSVAPHAQGRGIGGALVRQGLDWIRTRGAKGCVVLGDPRYYQRFGFAPEAGLVLQGVPPEYFQALPFGPTAPEGEVRYSDAFSA